MQDNALLIRRAQKGDAEAFEALMAPHERRLYALCLRMLGSREDAMDCLQDAMLNAWRALASYRREASFSTWCYRIATNACLDYLRRRKARPTGLSLEALADTGFLPTATGGDPQAHTEAGARRDALRAGIDQLPDDLRAALVLRDMQGFSYEEVAEITDTPLGTVKSRISRARDRLRGNLAADRELFTDTPVQASERRKDK